MLSEDFGVWIRGVDDQLWQGEDQVKIADPKHLGARIGIILVLRSWGSTMTHYPHVHMIVSGGHTC